MIIPIYAVKWPKRSDLISLRECDIGQLEFLLERPVYVCKSSGTRALTDGNNIYISVYSDPGTSLISLSSVVGVLHGLKPSISQIVNGYLLRNYLEPGNVLVVDDIGLSVFTYAVLGDTHHMHGAFSYAANHLLQQRYDLVTSLANPHHINIFSQYTPYICQYPAYGFGDPGDVTSALSLIRNADKQRSYSFTCCGSLTPYQVGRRAFLKGLMKDSHLLDQTLLFPYQSHQNRYQQTLKEGYFAIIPSLNGQFSPQILSALMSVSIPILDSFHIIGTDASYELLNHFCISRHQLVLSELSQSIYSKYLQALPYLSKWLNEAYKHRLKYAFEHQYFFQKCSNYVRPKNLNGSRTLDSIESPVPLQLFRMLDNIYRESSQGVNFPGRGGGRSTITNQILSTLAKSDLETILPAIRQLSGTSGNHVYTKILTSIPN